MVIKQRVIKNVGETSALRNNSVFIHYQAGCTRCWGVGKNAGLTPHAFFSSAPQSHQSLSACYKRITSYPSVVTHLHLFPQLQSLLLPIHPSKMQFPCDIFMGIMTLKASLSSVQLHILLLHPSLYCSDCIVSCLFAEPLLFG